MANKPLKSIKFPGLPDTYTIDSGLSEAAKQALLSCFRHVAWTDEHGQDYYDALEAALDTGKFPKITAVFLQGNHVVYSGSSLDALKPYLTITYYTDSSTYRILSDSEYTLSGELNVGVNSVQVVYATVTTNFTVTAIASGLPSGYTPYDYLRMKPKSEINPSAYDAGYANANIFGFPNFGPLITTKTFDDLFALNYHFKSKFDRSINETPNYWTPIIGGRVAANADAKSMALYRCNDYKKFSVHSHGANIQFDYSFDDLVYDYKIINPSESPSEVRINDDVVYEIPWTNTNVVNYMLGLLTNRTSSDTVLYVNNVNLLGALEITDHQGAIVANYIPVLRESDNVIGIYDTVAQEFRTAQMPRYATIGNTYCVYSVGNWS